jgi:hypothetical protein
MLALILTPKKSHLRAFKPAKLPKASDQNIGTDEL